MDATKIWSILAAFYDLEARDFNDLINQLLPILKSQNYITNDFGLNIMKREQSYPTGLAFDEINIAIPHTDAIYVQKSGLVVIKLKKPIVMIHMATTDVALKVQYLVLLLVKDANHQVDFLTSLITKFKDKQFIKMLKQARNQEELITIFTKGD